MSNVITREVYSAVEVNVNEFNDEALTEELEDRGHYVLHKNTLEYWQKMREVRQDDLLLTNVLRMLDTLE